LVSHLLTNVKHISIRYWGLVALSTCCSRALKAGVSQWVQAVVNHIPGYDMIWYIC